MIKLEHVSKSYTAGIPALNDVSLDIEEGEFVFIVGDSGSGKSTLIKLLLKELEPTEGTITINNKKLNKIKRRQIPKFRRNIGVVFQDFRLLKDRTVFENVAFAQRVVGASPRKIREEVPRMLKLVGLSSKYKSFPHQLSGGEQQRVAIARALINRPEVLLADEPTGNLDSQNADEIMRLLEEINRNLHITIVIITHQMAVVREICTKVAILKDGEVVEKGSVEEIFNNPKSQVAKELILTDGSQQTDLKPVIQSGDRVRIVFSENSAFEPVIANMILKFHEPVNILKADTKNVGGVAKGEMILEFPGDSEKAEAMKQYLKERGLAIGEVTDSVD